MDSFYQPAEVDVAEPVPDITALFMYYNKLYFDDVLETTSVQWSSERMTRYISPLRLPPDHSSATAWSSQHSIPAGAGK